MQPAGDPAGNQVWDSARSESVPTGAPFLKCHPDWNINKRAHAAVVKVLEGKDLGKNGNISTANGEVTLDLRPAITRLATRLRVEDKLKANADPNAGQLVIMKSRSSDRRLAAALFLFLILLAWGPMAGNRQLLGVAILAATTAVAIEALRPANAAGVSGESAPGSR